VKEAITGNLHKSGPKPANSVLTRGFRFLHDYRIKAPGRYNALVGSERDARRLLQQAMPDGVELPPAVAGQSYPTPAPDVKKWSQLQPPEPDVGHILPHFK
jgi:hypothetical protein